MSRTLTDLPWQNSARLDSVDELAALKERTSGDLVVLTVASCRSTRSATAAVVLIATYVRTTS